MKIIGYGICGPGEAQRYMRQTLEEFKRLCDETIILVNATPKDALKEIEMIEEFGFIWKYDTREWGTNQWKIKQDFLEGDVSKIAKDNDMMVCLDMDEVLDKQLNREWILNAELDAYHVFIVNLWNEGHKAIADFWNVRMWRWNGDTKMHEKALHCGLAPAWAYYYHRFAPFILKHYGLKQQSDRERKIARYDKYDPNAKYKPRSWYNLLKSNTCDPFDEQLLHDTIAKEVATYKQTKPRGRMTNTPKIGRFAYVRNAAGNMVDIPERHLAETLKRGGFTFLGWADDAQEEIAKMFEDDVSEPEHAYQHRAGVLQRDMKSVQSEVEERNALDEVAVDEFMGTTPAVEPILEDSELLTNPVAISTKVVARKSAAKKAK